MTTDIKKFLRELRASEPDIPLLYAVGVCMSQAQFDDVLINDIVAAAREVFAEPQPSTLEPAAHPALI